MRGVYARTGAKQSLTGRNATQCALGMSQIRFFIALSIVPAVTSRAVHSLRSFVSLTPELLMTPLRFLPLLLLFSVACSSSSNSPTTAPEPSSGDQPRAFIENRASIDMDVYLLPSGGQSIRLGFLAGGEHTTFPLPATVTAGS